MSGEKCAVCGMGGYWVAWAPAAQEWRCVNHIEHGQKWPRFEQATEEPS